MPVMQKAVEQGGEELSLPKWVEDVSKETGANRADFTPRLIQAIAIMSEAFESILYLESNGSTAMEACKQAAEEAMREVDDLGEEP